MKTKQDAPNWYCEGCKTFHLPQQERQVDDMGDYYCARAWKRLINPQNTTFKQRVNYAREGFCLGEDSRAFDNCFEMYDGAFVVAALMRLSETDHELKQAIERHMSKAGLAEWQQTTASLAHIPTHKLSQKAATHRQQVEASPTGYQQPSLF
ncbi:MULTISPECIES: hypothetical protein [unclassified Pseudovibrio]|uniref:hypothetical protein n=1 Tax=unclassified Pseudovibrio TaxID=2627060 RepID=UPI0007AE76D4|nr:MULTISPECIES: hypothetical protein [unclassified Pseudovibrio]KZK92515.1 hypothetical protein PsW74_05442 [Pseudovibrio sp. W74]KZL10765.1 hypothetical protein PsAD14_01237 [Pseudovibrio sp. Ad14]